jgi:hypothetical protein
MAETLPTGEQIRFRSANTGDHVLDTYLESAEIGGRSLTDLLDDLFDPANNGTFRSNNFEFRFDPSTDKIQFRVGQFANNTSGWSDLTTFFSIEGTFSTSTTYNNFDVVTLANKDVYIVHGLSSGTTFSSESNFISSANTEKLVDVSNAQDWASKVNGIVDSTDYSSKAYAIGGTGVDTGSGSAKDWAIKTGGTVGNTSENSAKHHATAAASSASTATTQANLATTNGAAQVTLATAQVALATTQANNSATSATSSATSATNSANSASAASTSETNAAASAATATTQAGLATSNGAAQVALATTQASNAASSASAAAASQTSAAASAAAAASAFDNFDDDYLGSKTSDPSTDNDGDALATGALYFNSTANEMRVYDGANWIAASSAGTASLLIYKYTATSNQTTFSGSDDASNALSYSADNLIITLNGVVLELGTDVTASNGTSVVLASGAAANDELNIYAFKSFTTADMVSKSNGGAFQGNVDFGAGIDVTGNITVTGTVDGRDIATDGTKLDGIEASADVTDATNVANAGALMTSGGTLTGDINFGDDDKAVFGAGNDFSLHHNSTTGENLLSLTAGPLEMHQAGINSVLQVHNDGTNHNQLVQFFKGNSSYGNISTDTGKLIIGADGELSLKAGGGLEIVTINNTGDVAVKGQGSNRAMMLLQAGSNTSNSQLRFGDQAADSAGRIYYDHSSNFMRFDTNESERMRIDSNGVLLVGKTADSISNNGISLAGSATGGGHLSVTNNGNSCVTLNRKSSDGEIINFRKDGITIGSISAGNGDLRIGTGDIFLRFFDAGTAFIPRTAADNTSNGVVDLGNTSNRFKRGYFNSTVYAAGIGGVGDEDTYINFANNNILQFVIGGQERARFQSSNGVFQVGKTDASLSTSGSYLQGDGFIGATRSANPPLGLNRLSTDGDIVIFQRTSNTVGTIGITSSGVTYNTTSDIRLKQDIEPLQATDKLMAMNPVSYNWKSDPDGPRSMGFIAQEMEEVMPEAVSTGDDDMMSMDYGRITPILVSALQDAHKKIEQLEQRLADMEAK